MTIGEDLYPWLREAFGDREFTSSEFQRTFPSPAPAKTLFDLRRHGFIERMRKGVYKVNNPEDRLRDLTRREGEVFDLPESAHLPYAYSDDTSISIWTEGRYWTGFTSGFRPLHINVKESDIEDWKKFFRNHGARAAVLGSRETLFGVVHIMHPVRQVKAVKHGNVRVVPKEDAYAFAASRPYTYEPVLPVLAPSGLAER